MFIGWTWLVAAQQQQQNQGQALGATTGGGAFGARAGGAGQLGSVRVPLFPGPFGGMPPPFMRPQFGGGAGSPFGGARGGGESGQMLVLSNNAANVLIANRNRQRRMRIRAEGVPRRLLNAFSISPNVFARNSQRTSRTNTPLSMRRTRTRTFIPIRPRIRGRTIRRSNVPRLRRIRKYPLLLLMLFVICLTQFQFIWTEFNHISFLCLAL